jgi:hypothetical protein
MALQTSGQISLNDIHVEAGGSSGSQASINDSDIRGLIGKGSGAQMSFSEWYGAANEVPATSEATINGVSSRKQMLASDFVSAGGTLTIPSSLWVWSDDTSVAALTIDVSCTIKNSGRIIGKGGKGGSGGDADTSNKAKVGGPAIKINSGISGVTIQNLSGAYIAGGGGGGGGTSGRGGGGAGGGFGGGGTTGAVIASAGGSQTGEGGILNAAGERGTDPYAEYQFNICGQGGGAGGGGGGKTGNRPRHGGGGGRILPGTGGAGGVATYNGGAGGSGGNAGTNAVQNGTAAWDQGGGGGGGWGAKGGNGANGHPSETYTGAAAGKAIDDSGVSYSLSNSGTIYGGT